MDCQAVGSLNLPVLLMKIMMFVVICFHLHTKVYEGLTITTDDCFQSVLLLRITASGVSRIHFQSVLNNFLYTLTI